MVETCAEGGVSNFRHKNKLIRAIISECLSRQSRLSRSHLFLRIPNSLFNESNARKNVICQLWISAFSLFTREYGSVTVDSI